MGKDRRRAGTRTAAMLGAAVAAVAAAAPLAVADPAFTAAAEAGPLTGLATDASREVYWTAAQSAGTVTALGADGAVRGTVSYGATPVDVEAVSYRDGRLWIGDIGDPQGTRKTVTAYRIGTFTFGSTAPYRSYTLSYADGPQDAAAMTVSPKGRLYVVTRGSRPGVYRGAVTLNPGGPVNTLTRVADAPAGVTDATFGTDGSSLVLRTSTSVHVLDPYDFTPKAAAELPATAQGQALTTSLDDRGLLVSGQGSPVPVEQVAVPTTLASVSPAPSAAPSASASPSASARPSTVDEVASSHGTLWALLAAAAISAVAGAVVALKP